MTCSLSSVLLKDRQRRSRSQLGHRSFLLSIHLIISMFAILQLPNWVANGQDVTTTTEKTGKTAGPVDIEKVEAYVKHFNNSFMDVFTYEQLQKWFEVRGDDYRVQPWSYPRAFPFCVTRNQIVQGHDRFTDQSEHNLRKVIRVSPTSHLTKFERYFHGVELRRKRFYQFEPEKDSTKFNKTFIKDITFSRINTPEPDMVNLRQWVHITVRTEGRMAGLYMQAIVGPFGLPFGEFSVDFNCSDSKETEDMDKVGELVYCSYRPNASIYHPTAFVAYDDVKKRNEFHVHFRYFDLACMETPYIQFLMLVVKNKGSNPTYGVDYVAQVSPVYNVTGFDSRDGAPYPYYPGFRGNMWCFLKNHGDVILKYGEIPKALSVRPKADRYYADIPIGWRTDNENDLTRIQPNEEYDECVLYDNFTNYKIRNEAYYECGPVRGPFQCDVDFSKGAEALEERKKGLVNDEADVTKCLPCGVPECTRIGFHPELCDVELPHIQELDGETNVLSSLDDDTRIRTHGISAMLAFLFFIPITHFVGRFYKEVMERRLFGNGPWIFVHLLCSMLSFGALWSSMGPMIPAMASVKARERTCRRLYEDIEDPDYEECLEGHQIRSPHTTTGSIAYTLVHFIPLFGFVRPASDKLRLIISAIHSHLAYLTYVLGVVSVFLGLRNSCGKTIVLCSILTALPFVFSIIAFILDYLSDRSLGVTPPRKQWPVLEELELDTRGPYEVHKLAVLGVFIVVMLVVYLMAMSSLQIATNSTLADGKSDCGAGAGNTEGTTTIAPP